MGSREEETERAFVEETIVVVVIIVCCSRCGWRKLDCTCKVRDITLTSASVSRPSSSTMSKHRIVSLRRSCLWEALGFSREHLLEWWKIRRHVY